MCTTMESEGKECSFPTCNHTVVEGNSGTVADTKAVFMDPFSEGNT